jgi:hypothetical protein
MQATPIRTETIQTSRIMSSTEYGWFHQVHTSLAYFHGGVRLMTGPAHSWPNASVTETTRQAFEDLCRTYRIDASSSIELVAFRADYEVAKKHPRDGDHWYQVSDEDTPPSYLICAHQMWNSRTPDLMQVAPAVANLQCRFEYQIPIQGLAIPGQDLTPYAHVRLKEPGLELLLQGIGIVEGRIGNLSIIDANAMTGRVARVIGSIDAHMTGGFDPNSRSVLAGLLLEHLNVEVRSKPGGIFWDGNRIEEEHIEWLVTAHPSDAIGNAASTHSS